MSTHESRWFQHFVVIPDDLPEDKIVWADQQVAPRTVRKATKAERRALILIGAAAIAFNVFLVVVFFVALYLSRR